MSSSWSFVFGFWQPTSLMSIDHFLFGLGTNFRQLGERGTGDHKIILKILDDILSWHNRVIKSGWKNQENVYNFNLVFKVKCN